MEQGNRIKSRIISITYDTCSARHGEADAIKQGKSDQVGSDEAEAVCCKAQNLLEI